MNYPASAKIRVTIRGGVCVVEEHNGLHSRLECVYAGTYYFYCSCYFDKVHAVASR